MISLMEVSRWYGMVLGLNRVSLDLESGVTGLLGVNGAGKSTLLNICAGLLLPSTGSVTLGGKSIFANPEALRLLGYCPSVDHFYEEMTGLDFVAYLARLSGYSQDEAMERAVRTCREVSLVEEAHYRMCRMSKGMRQKVKIAQALVHDPDVVLLDEPLNGMDPRSRVQTIELIRKLGEAGKHILVSSHVLHEVEAMTSRILLLDRGRILASGEVLEVREAIHSRPLRIFLRCADARLMGAELSAWPCVLSVSFSPDGRGITLEVSEAGRFYRDLTALLSKRDLGIEIINPLDDNLAAVFEYLVK